MMKSKDFKDDLINLADKKYKEFHSGLCPGVDNILGIRVPVLRDYAKKIYKENVKEKNLKLEDLLNNIDDEFYEEIMLQGMLIGLAKNEDIDNILKYVENFIPKINNWAVCDVFCAGLKMTNKNKEKVWDFIQKYLSSDKEFYIRFGVVIILDYFIQEEYLEKNFEIFDKIKSDKYYVQMAVAWAVSICLIKFYKETVEYLERCNLDKFTYNKSIQKAIESYRITEEQKSFLRNMKRL